MTPEEPTPSLPKLTVALRNDSGEDAHDRITNDSTIVVSGLEDDAEWRYRIDGGEWKVGSADGVIAAKEFGIEDGDRRVEVQ